jgi:hypothetical protein
VAEETRKKFDLEKLAHTTVGREMKALAKTLAETAAIDIEAAEEAAHETGQYIINVVLTSKRQFPSVRDTGKNRKIVKSFFYEKLKSRCQEWFTAACDLISIYWYAHFHRLLMNTAPVIGCKLSTVI